MRTPPASREKKTPRLLFYVRLLGGSIESGARRPESRCRSVGYGDATIARPWGDHHDSRCTADLEWAPENSSCVFVLFLCRFIRLCQPSDGLKGQDTKAQGCSPGCFTQVGPTEAPSPPQLFARCLAITKFRLIATTCGGEGWGEGAAEVHGSSPLTPALSPKSFAECVFGVENETGERFGGEGAGACGPFDLCKTTRAQPWVALENQTQP